MTDRVARLRVRSVRMKNGGASVRVFHQPEYTQMHRYFVGDAEIIAAKRTQIAGYAIVVWTTNGSTSVAGHTMGLPVPKMLMPDFVKTCVSDWLLSETKPPSPDSA